MAEIDEIKRGNGGVQFGMTECERKHLPYCKSIHDSCQQALAPSMIAVKIDTYNDLHKLLSRCCAEFVNVLVHTWSDSESDRAISLVDGFCSALDILGIKVVTADAVDAIVDALNPFTDDANINIPFSVFPVLVNGILALLGTQLEEDDDDADDFVDVHINHVPNVPVVYDLSSRDAEDDEEEHFLVLPGNPDEYALNPASAGPACVAQGPSPIMFSHEYLHVDGGLCAPHAGEDPIPTLEPHKSQWADCSSDADQPLTIQTPLPIPTHDRGLHIANLKKIQLPYREAIGAA